ncbi:hypothetical protein P4637_20155 [Halalkalibacterium halodurans]|uniref:hypothetical protein n=1 Tax=Halalkalibacterium halodurans TaxID=86665 RepID=UPI002E23102E|nr:hypothetical protein [Halalkalibacterium halodurans]MED4087127.1 hypothetical protein [Halalkalibacterium halodurans]MED4105937.1 hypothetical protein [Halalkalibacterium halodurans]MED4110932.1 hypothetical protein [Halalkalibacterium halodurans]MED4125928.1 hypothetical protein [Halalkalibacterium halodurans]
MNSPTPEQTLTKEQLTEIKGKIHACSCFIQYHGHPKPHFNTVSTYIKHSLNIRKLEDIPQHRFYEVLALIRDYQGRYGVVQ